MNEYIRTNLNKRYFGLEMRTWVILALILAVITTFVLLAISTSAAVEVSWGELKWIYFNK
jgi:hypothetical protein